MIHALTVKGSLGNQIDFILTWQHACGGQPLYTEASGHHSTALSVPASAYERHSGNWEKNSMRPREDGIFVGKEV